MPHLRSGVLGLNVLVVYFQAVSSYYMPCLCGVVFSGCNLYDARSGNVWRLASSAESLLQSFKGAYWSTQLAILHYLILLRTRDIFTIRQVCGWVCG